MKLKWSCCLIFFLVIYPVYSQFSIKGEYMNRAELRNGYQTLLPKYTQTNFFISQRARFGGTYSKEKYSFNFVAQDIRVWGNTSNVGLDTAGYLSVFEANVSLNFSTKFSAKIGRQVIAYDDHRIFGSLDWAMQARRHDAAIFKYSDSTLAVHAGFAYNQSKAANSPIFYNINNYQNFQFLWLNKKWNKFKTSFLFLNNGVEHLYVSQNNNEQKSKTVFSQTIGVRSEYKNKKINLLGYAYYQMGKSGDDRDLSAYDICLEAGYKPTENLLFSLGGEMLSGTSQTDTANKVNRSFSPFYGTNHRFNGYMDYFYVGNHSNSVGLIDAYFKISTTFNKMIFSLNSHAFFSAADIKNNQFSNQLVKKDSHLGSEFDFTFLYNFTDGVSIQAGYSQMFGTSSLQELKGGSISRSNNWAYLMVIVRPQSAKKFPKVGLKF